MLVSTRHKRLVLNLKDPFKVRYVIASSGELDYNGRRLVHVPHRVVETRTLRMILGADVPSPVKFYYQWPRANPELFNPFEAQIETAAFVTMNDRCYVNNDMGCVDATTEYLSPSGWRRIDQYDGGQVAQYIPEAGVVQFVQPTEYVKKPCDEMIRFKTERGVDQLLSPEHRVLYVTSNTGRTKVRSAAEIEAAHHRTKNGWRGRFITTFRPIDRPGIPLTGAQIQLMVAVIADGHFPNKSRRCIVRVKKERKVKRLRMLLRWAGVQYAEREQDTATAKGYHVFSFVAPERRKVFGGHWWDATELQLRLIIDEAANWDSARRKAYSVSFSSYERESADFIQYAASGAGRTARLYIYTRERRGKAETEYVVHIRRGAALLCLNGVDNEGQKTGTVWREPSPDGFKYCFVVPSTYLVLRRNGCVFVTGNTGKTLACLWAYDYLRTEAVAEKLLVSAPLSALERAWADEVFKHFPHLTAGVLHGSRRKRWKLLDQDFDIYIVNHDGMEVIEDALKDRPDISHVFVDEVASLRNARTDRWKCHNRVINKQHRRAAVGITGTPTPHSPEDAFGQVKLVTPDNITPYFGQFRDSVMRKVSQYTWVARRNAMETVARIMQPAIRFTRDQCIDLPPTIFQMRYVPLTPEQAKAYRTMQNDLHAQLVGGQILAVNEGVKVSKLIQIACGAAYDGNHNVIEIPAGPRLEELKEVIEQAGTKVIVFVPLTGALNILERELSKYWSVATVHGGVSKSKRDEIFRLFQNAPDPHVLVANPETMSHALTLTEAGTIVWYAPPDSNETFDQANHRIIRPGQKNTQFIVMLEGTPIERRTYTRLKNQQSLQGVLLEMLASGESLPV